MSLAIWILKSWVIFCEQETHYSYITKLGDRITSKRSPDHFEISTVGDSRDLT
jgi:hypothetical protein